MFDRSQIMKAAWQLYRETYQSVIRLPFERRCFAWALREAWRRAREAARIAAIPADVRQARVAALTAEIDALSYKSAHLNIQRRERELRDQIAALAA